MVVHALIQQGFHALFTRVRQRTFHGGDCAAAPCFFLLTIA
jgi:hypothetical protein